MFALGALQHDLRQKRKTFKKPKTKQKTYHSTCCVYNYCPVSVWAGDFSIWDFSGYEPYYIVRAVQLALKASYLSIYLYNYCPVSVGAGDFSIWYFSGYEPYTTCFVQLFSCGL